MSILGLVLGIVLHIRLSCCLKMHRITSAFHREQQLTFYILYFLMCFTITSIPFYLGRVTEILFDSMFSFDDNNWINSTFFAQILLMGVSFNPIIYALLFIPSKLLCRLNYFLLIQLVSAQISDNDGFSRIYDTRIRRKYIFIKTHQNPFLYNMYLFKRRLYLKSRTH